MNRYKRFFDAVWRGDVDAAKQLAAPGPSANETAATQDRATDAAAEGSSSDDNRAAPATSLPSPYRGHCLAATRDATGLSALTLAVVLGHADMAAEVLRMAKAQYRVAVHAPTASAAKPPVLINNIDLLKTRVRAALSSCRSWVSVP